MARVAIGTVTVSDIIDGERGSRAFYGTVTNGQWSDTAANAVITGEGHTKVLYDQVTLSDEANGFSETRYWNSSWIKIDSVIDGNLIVGGTLTIGGEVLTTANTLNSSNTAASVGARPDSWTPTASDVGLSNVDNTSDATVLAASQAQADLISEQLKSAGEQLTVNGSGALGDNTNFSGFTYDGSQSPDGFAGSFYIQSGSTTKTNDDFIPVDATQRYKQNVWIKGGPEVSKYYLGTYAFDIDKNGIYARHHMYRANTLTTLAQDLNDGDTIVHLTDSTDWYNGGTAGVSTHYRSLIIWNHVNSFGYLYPPETYSRNWTGNAWDPGAIVGNDITLNNAWSGGTIPAGTPISNGGSGGSYKYNTAGNVSTTENWVEKVGYIGTIDYTGTNVPTKFPPGTAFVRHLMLLNRDATSSAETWVGGLAYQIEYETPEGSQSKADAALAGDKVSGTVGGWTIDSSYIWSGTKKTSDGYSTSGITLSSGGSIRAPKFRLDTGGDAHFLGDITGSNITGASLSGATITGGTVQTAETGKRVVLTNSSDLLTLYNQNDEAVFGTDVDASGNVELFFKGKLRNNTIDDALFFTTSGISSLRGRLGMIEPSVPTGGTISYGTSSSMTGDFQITGSGDENRIFSGGNVMTMSLQASGSYTYTNTSSDHTSANTPVFTVQFYKRTSANGTTWGSWVAEGALKTITGYKSSYYVDFGGETGYTNRWDITVGCSINVSEPVGTVDGTYYQVRAVVAQTAGHGDIDNTVNSSLSSFIADEPANGSIAAHRHNWSDLDNIPTTLMHTTGASMTGRLTTTKDLQFTGTGVGSGIMFNSTIVSNDAAGIRQNGTNNVGELEFFTTDDDTEPFVFRHYTTGQTGEGSNVQWMKVDATGIYEGTQLLSAKYAASSHTHSTYLAKPGNHTTNDTEYDLTWENKAGALYTSSGDLSYNPANKRITTGVFKTAGGDSNNWNTAYGWGNHASQGYKTTDTNTHRAIHDSPSNGSTTTSISSNWAYDHAASSTAHPRDTRSQIAGSYAAASHTHSYLPLAGGKLTGELAFPEKQVVNRRFEMIENASPQYILLCVNAGNNDVNGRVTMDRTSGNWQACQLDIVVSSSTSAMQGGTIRSLVATQSNEEYTLVTLTHDSVSYVAIQYTGNTYPETTGAWFTGRISSTGSSLTVVSTGVSAVTPLASIGKFEINGHTIYNAGNNNIGTGSTNYAAGNHTHSYLPLAGGTLTGSVKLLNNKWLYFGNGGDELRINASGASSPYLDVYNQTQGGFAPVRAAAFYVTGVGNVYHPGNTNIGTGSTNYAAGNHTHSYLPLSGGTMTGALTVRNNPDSIRGHRTATSMDDRGSTQEMSWSYTGTTAASSTTNMFSHLNNANGVLTFNKHSGGYLHQLGFSSNGALYQRYKDGSTWSSWGQMYDSRNNNIGTGATNYSAGNHTHSYLPLSGGTLTGRLNLGGSKALTMTSTTGWTYLELKSAAYIGHMAIKDASSDGAAAGSMHLRPAGVGNGSLMIQPNNQMIHKTSHGELKMGLLNTVYAHFSTTASSGFYFYQGLDVHSLSSRNGITAPTFTGALAGNATTATTATNLGSSLISSNGGQDFTIRGNRALVGTTSNLIINYGNDFTNVDVQSALTASSLTSDTNITLVGNARNIHFDNSSDSNYDCYIRNNYDHDGWFRVDNGAGVTAFSLYQSGDRGYFGGYGGSGQRIFADNYHPNADTWTTARTLTLTGDATGSVSIDGAANKTLTVTVKDNSHNHAGHDVKVLGHRLTVDSDGKIRANHTDYRRAGMYGTYDSYRIGHIWSMGSGYQIHASGTNFGNLYGLAYKHTNNATGGTMAGGHQMVWAANGTAKCSLGDSIWTSGNVTAYSDARVKENLEVIDDALDKVKKLKGYTYDRTDVETERNEHNPEGRHVGVIAQEVLKVLPEAVTGGPTDNDPDNHYAVSYGNLTALLIEAIKEQQGQIDELKRRLDNG